MIYIIVDLEMNPVDKQYKKQRRICNREIIEIGAVALNGAYDTISEFKTYVKPEFSNGIHKAYEDLTGITDAMVSSAPNFIEAYDKFIDWCKSFQEDYEIYAWSDNDYKQIESEMKLKGYDDKKKQNTLINWNDFQREFSTKLGLERIMSLEAALDCAGIEFKGKRHDALSDSKNTAELFLITREEEKCKKILQYIIDVLKPKQFTSTLGSMIDFGTLMKQLPEG